MYQKKIVTFIDILGFRDMVMNRAFEDVMSISSKFQDASGEGDEPIRGDPQVISFSDSIVRVHDAEESGDLFHELLSLVHIQAELAGKGVLIRGGVALGDVHVEGTVAFGPAFIDAYDMEANFARVPKIALSPSLLRAYFKDEVEKTHGRDHEDGFFRALLSQGSDGTWFVNYLLAFAREVDDLGGFGTYLRLHRETVDALVQAAGGGAGAGLTPLTQKALWLGRYHNDVVGQVADAEWEASGLEAEDVRVDLSQLDAHFEFDVPEPTRA